MLNVLMAIVTILLVLGLLGNAISCGVFAMVDNHVGLIVCAFVFVLYLGIALGCIYFYNLNKCDTHESEKKYLKGEISRLEDDIKWYEDRLKSYKKLDKFVKEHNEFELKQSKLEEENKKLKSIILAQNNVKSGDSEQYLKVITEYTD